MVIPIVAAGSRPSPVNRPPVDFRKPYEQTKRNRNCAQSANGPTAREGEKEQPRSEKEHGQEPPQTAVAAEDSLIGIGQEFEHRELFITRQLFGLPPSGGTFRCEPTVGHESHNYQRPGSEAVKKLIPEIIDFINRSRS